MTSREFSEWVNERNGYRQRIAELEAEVERLSECCTRRGARMQIMRDWMDSNRGIGPPSEWWYFCEERPEANKWFDHYNVPVDAAIDAARSG